MQSMKSTKDKELLSLVINLINTTPNDLILGGKIRELFFNTYLK